MIVVGVDLGQSSDFTAIAVARRGSGRPSKWEVPHLDRLPLGTSYVEAAKHVVQLLARPELKSAHVAVDKTGVGTPVCDFIRSRLTSDQRSRFRPICLTSGTKPTCDGNDGVNVPKRDIVGLLQVTLQAGRLHVAREPPLADILAKEMIGFQSRITPLANETFGAWRENSHDDLLLALGIALWVGEKTRELSMPIADHFAAKFQPPTAPKTQLETILDEIGLDLFGGDW